MLYGCDGLWWKLCKGVPEFEGLRISQDVGACAAFANVNHVTVREPECNELLVEEPGVIGAGGNSGYQALNIAAQFGAMRIGLVGFDMRIDNGHHWHGAHARGLNNPSQSGLKRWRKAFNDAAPVLQTLGVDVVNLSPDSALTGFPKMSMREALARWNLNEERQIESAKA